MERTEQAISVTPLIETKPERLDRLFRRFTPNFQGRFLDLMRLVVLHDFMDGTNFAFVVIHDPEAGYQLGLAIENRPGYAGTDVYFQRGTKWGEAEATCIEMNSEVLGVGPQDAFGYAMSTIRAKMPAITPAGAPINL